MLLHTDVMWLAFYSSGQLLKAQASRNRGCTVGYLSRAMGKDKKSKKSGKDDKKGNKSQTDKKSKKDKKKKRSSSSSSSSSESNHQDGHAQMCYNAAASFGLTLGPTTNQSFTRLLPLNGWLFSRVNLKPTSSIQTVK